MNIKFFFYFFLFKFIFLSTLFSQDINELQVNGNKRLSVETIKLIGEIDFNKAYNDEQLNDLINNLYDSNFFNDVSIKIDNQILIIDLIENPIIDDLQIVGIKQESLKEILLDNISLKNRSSFNKNFLNKDINFIQNFLKSTGYYFAKISPTIIENKDLNTVRLSFNIDLGVKAKIKKINFIGDKKIKDKKLLEIIASEEDKFWKFISRNTYLDQNRIDLDIRLLKNYYKNLGYYNVDVLSSFAEFNKKGNFNLTYNISAGDIYNFNEFELNLPDNYNPMDFKSIQNQFSKLTGKSYSIDDFNKILNDIEKIASSKLYDFIDAKVEEEVIDNNKINFIFNVNDSNSHYVENINILGNYNTIEEVIRNKLIVDEGDPLNNILFNKSIDEIRSLGFFKKVETSIKDGSNQNLKNIDIVVEEKPTGEISLAAGVGTSGTTIGGGIVEKNFLGKGINLISDIELSESSIKGRFIYSKPNFAYTDNTLSTSLRSTSTDNLSDFGYKASELGFSIGSEYEQFENIFYSPSLDITLEDLETNSNASKTLINQRGKYNDVYFNYGLNYDLRNSKFRPTSGSVTSFRQELPLYSDIKEIKNTFIFTKYKKLSKKNDLDGKASFYIKSVNALDSSKDVRVSKRSNIPYSRLRGFENGKIGPVDNNDYVGGNYAASLNLSTNLPFLLTTLDAVDFFYFFDVANVWGVDYDSNINDSNVIRSSTGLGVDFLTPVGPLNFSFSQPLTKSNTDKTETFRFNLGTTF